MMHLSRGTYRIERRHLDDPLQPYLAPIRDLPSLQFAYEYSAEPLPVVPSLTALYPHMFESVGWYGARPDPLTAAISKWRTEGPKKQAIGRTANDDSQAVKKRVRVKTEEKRKPKLRKTNRTSATAASSSASSRASSRASSSASSRTCSEHSNSESPYTTTLYPPTTIPYSPSTTPPPSHRHQGPRLKLEPIDQRGYLMNPPTRNQPPTTVIIKQEPEY